MNWLYSIVVAGLMFTAESDLLPLNHNTYKNKETSSIVKFDETEKFEQSYPLNANGRVNVSNVNGSITVEAWDRNEVKLEAVKVADTRENLADVEIKIDSRQDSFSVEADYDNTNNRSKNEWRNHKMLEVQFRLSVPRTAVLNEIETVNGSVTVSNFVNYTKVSAVNGEVKATNLRGNANLSTVNGSVDAVFDRLETGSKISLGTVNGRVNLLIPSDSNATVKADTLNGSINNDFGLPVRKGEYVGRDLYGKIGTGDVQIRLNSVNGGLTIGRKNDGKNLNPSVNLLSQKSNTNGNIDEDIDNDIEDDIETDHERNKRAKPPKPPKPPKAPKVAPDQTKLKQKMIEKTLENIEKDISAIPPQIGTIPVEAVQKSLEAVNEVLTEEMRARVKASADAQLERMKYANFMVNAPTIEKKTETFSVKGTPKVTINAKNCNVTVRGWDKSEVQYSVKKFSRNRNQPPIEVKTDHTDSTVDIKVVNNDAARSRGFSEDNNNISFEVYVPKKSNLRITNNGEIRLEGVSGELELNGADESINVRDSSGKLVVAADDGRIRIVGFRGELNAKSNDGETYLEGDFEKLSARTVDGSIILTLPQNADFNLESNAKTVIADGFALQPLGDTKSTTRWKVGKGGTNYVLYTTADGKISVRSKNTLIAAN